VPGDPLTSGPRVVQRKLVADTHDVHPLGQIRSVALEEVVPAGERFRRHVMQAEQMAYLVSSRMLFPSNSGSHIAVREALDIVRGQQGGVGAEIHRRIGQAHHVEHGMRVVTLALDQLDEEAAWPGRVLRDPIVEQKRPRALEVLDSNAIGSSLTVAVVRQRPSDPSACGGRSEVRRHALDAAIPTGHAPTVMGPRESGRAGGAWRPWACFCALRHFLACQYDGSSKRPVCFIPSTLPFKGAR
jgi:hypothetical protein